MMTEVEGMSLGYTLLSHLKGEGGGEGGEWEQEVEGGGGEAGGGGRGREDVHM